MFTIAKEFTFCASHQLSHLPDGHKCARMHGHNYTVRVVIESRGLNHQGFVVDYGELREFRDWIDGTLDHRHLNDVFGCPESTTAECLAMHLFTTAKPMVEKHAGASLIAVEVQETPTTFARYDRRIG